MDQMIKFVLANSTGKLVALFYLEAIEAGPSRQRK
jgi:hypothetical protein